MPCYFSSFSRLYLGIEGEGQIYFSMQKSKVIQWDKVVPTTAMVCNQNLRELSTNMISYLTPCESRKLCKWQLSSFIMILSKN